MMFEKNSVTLSAPRLLFKMKGFLRVSLLIHPVHLCDLLLSNILFRPFYDRKTKGKGHKYGRGKPHFVWASGNVGP